MVRRVQNKILPVRAIWELLSALVKPTSREMKKQGKLEGLYVSGEKLQS